MIYVAIRFFQTQTAESEFANDRTYTLTELPAVIGQWLEEHPGGKVEVQA